MTHINDVVFSSIVDKSQDTGHIVRAKWRTLTDTIMSCARQREREKKWGNEKGEMQWDRHGKMSRTFNPNKSLNHRISHPCFRACVCVQFAW